MRQLDVLSDFVPADFIELDTPVLCVRFFGTRAVLVGCEDGRVLEVHRLTKSVLRSLDMGGRVSCIDCTEAGRILAVGGGRVRLWEDASPVKRSQVDTIRVAGEWSIPNVDAALLSPSGREFIAVGSQGVTLGFVVQDARMGATSALCEDPCALFPAFTLARRRGWAQCTSRRRCAEGRREPRWLRAASPKASRWRRRISEGQRGRRGWRTARGSRCGGCARRCPDAPARKACEARHEVLRPHRGLPSQERAIAFVELRAA